MRKKREEEVAIISQIPELREQQINSIINNADQMKQQPKLQPLKPIQQPHAVHEYKLPKLNL